MDKLTQAVYDQVMEVLQKNQIDINSPFSVITKGMEIINRFEQLNGHEKKALLIKTLRAIAAGKDGVAGTADDVLPARVVEEIQRMVDIGLVDDYANVIHSVVKGKFDLNKVVDVATKTVPICCGLLGKKI